MGHYTDFEDDKSFSIWVNKQLKEDLNEIKNRQQKLIRKSFKDAIMITAKFVISTQTAEAISLPLSIYETIKELKSIYKEIQNIEKIPSYFYYKVMR